MNDLSIYPKHCRKNMRKLIHMLSSDAETVFAMMRMTALLMDLRMDDELVPYYIMMDCGIENTGLEVFL